MDNHSDHLISDFCLNGSFTGDDGKYPQKGRAVNLSIVSKLFVAVFILHSMSKANT